MVNQGKALEIGTQTFKAKVTLGTCMGLSQ